MKLMMLATHIKPCLKKIVLALSLLRAAIHIIDAPQEDYTHSASSGCGKQQILSCSAPQSGTSKVCMPKAAWYWHNWRPKTWQFIS